MQMFGDIVLGLVGLPLFALQVVGMFFGLYGLINL
jgi:hypothetical protein